jgi:methyl-accepting chemotaxis protein
MSSLNRRKIVLINKPFQYRIALYICGWVIALSFVYPILVLNLFDAFAQYMAVDPNGPQLSILVEQRKHFLFILVIFESLFFLLTFVGSIFMAHRISGPLHQLKNALLRMARGELDQPVRFRKRDYFQELATAANDLQQALQNRRQLKNDQIAQARAVLNSILDKIDQFGKPEKKVVQGFQADLEKAVLALTNAEHN